jgi:hypothetical protein
MTPEEAEAFEQDVELAGKLLHGIYHKDRDGLTTGITFLSKETTPTEQEGREALSRLLIGKAELIPRGIMWGLAELIDANVGQSPSSPRKLIFETVNHQYATGVRNAQIACWIYELRHEWPDEYGPEWDDVAKEWKQTRNKTYEEAIAAAVEKFGIGERQAKRIYAQTFLKGQRPKRRLKRRTKRKPKLRLVR